MTLEKPAGTASKLGSYELLKEQPGIGVGSTWIARSSGDTAESPQLFSVIRVHKHLTKKPETVETFTGDTRPVTGFKHPNAAVLVEVGNESGEVYLASDLHDGETLSALVAAAGAQGLPQPVVLRIALDVLAALAAAHAHDPALFHGELGPHQVLVGADGVSRLAGLVVSRALSRVTPPVGAKNHDRLSYAAPERVKLLSSPNPPPVDARADVFSAGVLLWEALSKQRLFTSRIEAAIVQKVLTAPISPLSGISGLTVPDSLSEAIQKALEREPAQRTQTVEELRAAIEAAGGDAVATADQVAAEVERLAGKAIATRRADIRAELTRRRSHKSPTIPPPAAPKPAGGPVRKATLLGIAAIKATAPPEPPKPSGDTPKPAEAQAAGDETESEKPASSPKPAAIVIGETPRPFAGIAASLPRPPAESINLEEIEVVARPPARPPPPPPVNKRATLLMGMEAPPPPETHNPPPRAIKPPTPAPAAVKETAKPPAREEAPRPPAKEEAAKAAAASVQALIEASGKTHTPASDGPSPRSKSGVAVEKVGPGSTLGRYEILMPVARGGMASVWAAKLPGSRGFQKTFAIKTMLPDVSDDPDFETMFLDEGKVAARIRHPNVVEIIDLGEQDDVLYLVMEWVEGDNLGALVKAARAHGGIPMPIILRIASQVCAGLHAAHELRDDDGALLDLVHRDISPANVLVSTSGFVKIVDFGIAKSKARLHVTRVGGMVKGKTPYLSPEQLGQQPIDRRSDLFSLGALLYVMATGLHPFRGETDSKTIENIALREPVALSAIAPNTPAEFEAVVLKALAKDPAERFATAAEMQRAIDHVSASLGFTTTEEDVAAFTRKALGETLTKRAQELRATIEHAEAGVEAPPAPAAEAAKPGATPAPEAAKPAGATPSPPKPGPKLPKPASATAETVKPPAAEEAAAKPAVEEEVSFESASGAPEPAKITEAAAAPATALPRSKKPEAVTLPEIPTPAEDEAEGSEPDVAAAAAEAAVGDESSSRPVTRADGDDDASEVEGLRPRRKPIGVIAVGAVLGLCAILGLVAAFSGGGKKDTTSRTTPTPTVAAAGATTPVGQGATTAPPPSDPPSTMGETPKPPAQPAPTQTVAAETAAPPQTAAPTPEPPAADTSTPVATRPTGKGTTRAGAVTRPTAGGGKTKTTKKPYNPGTL